VPPSTASKPMMPAWYAKSVLIHQLAKLVSGRLSAALR
jgi:hypothetical protein